MPKARTNNGNPVFWSLNEEEAEPRQNVSLARSQETGNTKDVSKQKKEREQIFSTMDGSKF